MNDTINTDAESRLDYGIRREAIGMIARSPCRLCGQPIGRHRAFFGLIFFGVIDDGAEFRLAHVDCLAPNGDESA